MTQVYINIATRYKCIEESRIDLISFAKNRYGLGVSLKPIKILNSLRIKGVSLRTKSQKFLRQIYLIS
ncbi:hypothetical protein BpHYR1_013895 [Brachionus plicatilis]|uniref:Uncharacterized protein n=1 Tax=Brachionus plicatilis TaxID=10195 RepID=A0A3M7RJF6_BRAPC|nr:hypothetical protein BpHYR1_013895 [Brachionus plicatilis]